MDRDEGEAAYDRRWASVQEQCAAARAEKGLGAAFESLIALGRELGSIPEQAPTTFHVLPGPGRRPARFMVQINPARRLRISIEGSAAGGADMLDRMRMQSASGGRHVGYELCAPRSEWPLIVWPQPYPLAPMHSVVAAATASRSQEFAAGGRSTIADLAAMAGELGLEWLVIFNGEGAGATQRRWHLQAFQRPAGHGSYPLEDLGMPSHTSLAGPHLVQGYPIAVLQFQGAIDAVIHSSCIWLRRWLRLTGATGSASLIATAVRAPGELRLWLVPRQRYLERSPQFAERLACLEMLGEFVLTTDDELQRLAAGSIGYETVAAALSSVQPPSVLAMLEASTR